MPTVFAHAWRSWNSARGIALLAIVAFAVGIGATTAIFTVVNGVILNTLPYSPANRFVALYGARFTEPGQYSSSNVPDLTEHQRSVTSFDAFGWFRLLDFNLTSPGEPQYVRGVAVTPSLAQHLGAIPMIGRWFSDETGAVISNALWKRLGANPAIVGSAMTLDNRALTIEGVMPPEFSLPVSGTVPASVQTDVWIYLDPLGRGQDEGAFYFSYARLKPGISIAQAQAEVTRVASAVAAKDPASHPAYTARVVSLREDPLTNVQSTLLVLFGAAALLLLISCANVATLLLARSVARARETAIRVALGASRRQLALRYFVEGSIVSLAGAVAGVLLSVVIVRAIMAVGSAYIPCADEISIDLEGPGIQLWNRVRGERAGEPGATLAGDSYGAECSAQRRRQGVGRSAQPSAVESAGGRRNRADLCAAHRQCRAADAPSESRPSRARFQCRWSPHLRADGAATGLDVAGARRLPTAPR